MNSSKNNLSSGDVSNSPDSANLTEQRILINVGKRMELETEGSKAAKSSQKKGKITDSHKECLKNYLKENCSVGPTEAMNRLHEEMDLKADVSNVSRVLKKTKEKVDQDGTELPLYDSMPGVSSRHYNYGYKLKHPHIECLKKCLSEDSCIRNAEARNRLYKETGLDVSIVTVRNTLKKLRKEINRNDIESPLPGLEANVGARTRNYGFNLNGSHIECLRKYLNENSFIGPTEANRRLRKETGLEVSFQTVRSALENLRKEIKEVEIVLPSSGSMSRIGSKLKYPHIERLKEYLRENIYIGNTEARNRLHKEMGLNISVTPIRLALIKLEKEINQEGIEPTLPESITKVRSRKKGHGFKIKDSHMECLRKYLEENYFIRSAEARNKLREETGLEVCVQTVYNALVELREQIDSGKTVKPSSTSGSKVESRSWSYGYKLKEVHIKCLKKYLKEDISIGSTKAMNRLHEETGLEVSIYPVQNALIKLRKEIYQENNELSSSTSESKVRSRSSVQGYKMKDLHIECIKKYLDENCCIDPKEAAEKLQEETGLKLSTAHIRKTLIKLKGEMDPEHLKLHSSITGIKHKGRKLKDSHIKCLEKYLTEDSSITLSEAKERLHKETGLEVHITSTSIVLKKLKEKIELK